MSRRKEPVIPADLLDQLLAGGDAAAALQQGGLLDSLKKALAERALRAVSTRSDSSGIPFAAPL
jgi:putative transposase